MTMEPCSVVLPINDIDNAITTRDILSGVNEDGRCSNESTAHQNGAVLQRIKFNADEPWERSLRRLLEDIPDNVNTTNASAAGIDHPRLPDLLLLSRTDSRDYALEIEDGMDDNSSIISRTTSPIRRHTGIHRINSVTNKHVKKSLFDSDDDESDTNGTCRLSHKFSTESLLLYYDQQHLEDRCEQEDDSERNFGNDHPRSIFIRKASVVYENDNHESWLRSVEEARQLPVRPMPHLYLPMF
jgi:hypothetical protein